MNNRHLTAFAALLCLAAAFGSGASAQEYSQPHVVVSTDKVRNNGKIYYSHVVQGRQTLYSISKAYNVTLQEIYDANPALNLETEGLKKDQIILIPVKEGRTGQPSVQETVAAEKASTKDESKEYFIHRVKWFEDLRSIARKYMVSKEAIKNINGMTSDKVRRKDEIKIPLHPESGRKPVRWLISIVEPQAQRPEMLQQTLRPALRQERRSETLRQARRPMGFSTGSSTGNRKQAWRFFCLSMPQRKLTDR